MNNRFIWTEDDEFYNLDHIQRFEISLDDREGWVIFAIGTDDYVHTVVSGLESKDEAREAITGIPFIDFIVLHDTMENEEEDEDWPD